MANFVVSGTPHVRSKESIQSIMRDVIIALVPATAAGIYYFGLRALILLFSLNGCMKKSQKNLLQSTICPQL